MFFEKKTLTPSNLNLILASLHIVIAISHTTIREKRRVFCHRSLPTPSYLLDMSVIPASLLVFLLCVSFHPCYARHLGAIGKESETKSLLPFKNDEMTKPGAGGDGKGMVNNNISKDCDQTDSDHKPLSSSLKAKKMNGQGEVMETASSSGAVKTEFNSVVAHKQRGDQEQPGFNSDYPCPQTHPPVHN